MESEVREVPGLPGYGADRAGHIYSRKRRGGRMGETWRRLSPYRSKSGYMRIAVTVDGKTKNVRVHRLVLLAFIGPPPDGTQACHGDGNRANNILSNLRWDTHAANVEDKRRHGTVCRGESHPTARFTDAQIAEIRQCVASGMGCRETARKFETTGSYVSRLVNMRYRTDVA